MGYYVEFEDGYINGVGIVSGHGNVTHAEYEAICAAVNHRKEAPSGYTYRLKTDTFEYELVEVDFAVETPRIYTRDELLEMSRAELSSICSVLKISENMTKQNMIELILRKQDE